MEVRLGTLRRVRMACTLVIAATKLSEFWLCCMRSAVRKQGFSGTYVLVSATIVLLSPSLYRLACLCPGAA